MKTTTKQKSTHGWGSNNGPTNQHPTALSTRPPRIHTDNARIPGISTRNLPRVLYNARGHVQRGTRPTGCLPLTGLDQDD